MTSAMPATAGAPGRSPSAIAPSAAAVTGSASVSAGLAVVDEPAAESGERGRGAECRDRADRDSRVVDGGEEAALVARHAEAAHGERPAS
jgi:hypothetical protein